MLRKKKTMFEKLLYLPLDMEPPPLDCLDKLNDVNFLDIIRDDFRNCWHVPLMFSSTDLNAKKEDIKYLDEPYKWTKFIDEFSTLKEWCEDVLFPFTGKSRIMIITTLPGETNPPHIDCSREKFNTLQHKFRYVLQGNVNDLVFMTDKKDIHIDENVDKPFIMSGKWPHYMKNTTDNIKFTLALGAPWDGDLQNENYIGMLNNSYKKYKKHYVNFENVNLPENYTDYYA